MSTQVKVEYALCDANLNGKLSFNNLGTLTSYMERQKERHGKYPSGVPCKITITIETEKLEWPTLLD